MSKNAKPIYLAEQRIERIIDLVSEGGFVSVTQLAKTLAVSEMTVRRDLARIESEGHIRRVHGGAVAERKTQIELAYRVRRERQQREKASIGRLAALLVKEGESIFVDAGTTTLAMVVYLKHLKKLKVITNSPPVQTELLDTPTIEVIMTGGQILRHTISLVGSIAVDNIAAMRFDWAFLGTAGIDVDRGLTHSSMEEIPVKKAAAASAAKVVVLADHTKFGYNALSLFLGINEIDIIISDRKIETIQTQLESGGHRLSVIWPGKTGYAV